MPNFIVDLLINREVLPDFKMDHPASSASPGSVATLEAGA
jgi:hypothetical protein